MQKSSYDLAGQLNWISCEKYTLYYYITQKAKLSQHRDHTPESLTT